MSLSVMIYIHSTDKVDKADTSIINNNNNIEYKGEDYRYTFEHESFTEHILVEVWKDRIFLKHNNNIYHLDIIHSFKSVNRYKYRVKYQDSHYDMLISNKDESYILQCSILNKPIYTGNIYTQIEHTRGRGMAPK